MSELRLEWQKSSFSTADVNQDCLEVACGPEGLMHFRESDDPSIVLTVAPARLAALLIRLRARS
jgi:uncharacterized protein DUF397